MFKHFFAVIGLCTAVFSAPDTLRQSMDTDESEPAYKVFYENGFYLEAIELLRTKIAERPDTVNIDYLTYLAFCYAAGGRQDSAIDVFNKILDCDSAFYLDTITTSPKILELFNNARADWRTRKSMPDSSSSPPPPPEPSPVRMPLLSEIPGDTVTASVPSREQAQKSTDGRRYAFAFVPGGAGKFYGRRPIHGAVALALQAIGMAVGFWAYDKRDDSFDPRHGWGDWNRHEYEKYSNLSKAGFGFFISAYTVSAADCIIHIRKTRRR